MTTQQSVYLQKLREAVIAQKTASLADITTTDSRIQSMLMQIHNYDQALSSVVIAIIQGASFSDLNVPCSPIIDKNEVEALNQTHSQAKRDFEVILHYKKNLDHIRDLVIQVLMDSTGE